MSQLSEPEDPWSSESGEDDGIEGDKECDDSGVEDASASGLATTAELEIEDDFDRLVQRIRGTEGSSTTNLLSKDWDFDIQEKVAEFRDDLKAASGIGRRAGRKRGRAPGPMLSQQIRALIGEGNQAYVDGNISEAIRIMQEVIRVEPRASSAWSVLAQCYDDQNEAQKALQLRIMAAHLRHDAEEWERLARQSKSLGYFQQALYCFGKLCSLDPSNVDAFWDRASLAKSIGEFRIARNALLAILKRYPHDLTVLSELRPILIDLSDFSLCATLFQDAFNHHQSLYPSGPPEDHVDTSADNAGSNPRCLGLIDVLVLADLYNSPNIAASDQAITAIRRGCRWLQGRSAQKYWDACEDDREYDPPGHASRAGDMQPGGYVLDINARQRLAVARIKMGEFEEGKMHSNIVLSYDVMDYAPLFAEIADAYFERDLYADAKPIYELLGADVGTSSLYILMQTAACYRMIGELQEAAEVYEHVKSVDPQNNEAKMKLAEIYEILNEPRKALELVYEVIDSRKKKLAQRDGTDAGQSGSLFEEKARPVGKSLKTGSSVRRQNKLSLARLKELEQEKEKEVLSGYKRVKELWNRTSRSKDGVEGPSKMAEAEREWLFEADKLVETFRETRNLFSTARNLPFRGMFPRQKRKRKEENHEEVDESRMASRLQLDLEHDKLARRSNEANVKSHKVDFFRGVSFEDWLKLFIQYAFLLTQRGQYDLADDMLRHILLSNAYQSRELQDTIRLALIACAAAANKFPVVVEQSRKFIGIYQFNNEPLHILLASLASGMRSTDAFITSTLQKHIFRELRLVDTAVKHPDGLKWNQLNRRWVVATGAKPAGEENEINEDDATMDMPLAPEKEKGKASGSRPKLPTTNNPVPFAIYGQICTAAKSYQSAIFYLLRAYEYHPDDPVICLSLAVASIGRAMQRQSDNRHHLIAQAVAFLSKYMANRGLDLRNATEVEFNFGRAFQQLGLHTLAVTHYERVLKLAEKQPSDNDCLAKEAAYNLSQIFVTTGANPLAEALYRQWLSI